MHAHTYVHTYTHTYVYTYTHRHIGMYIHTYTHTYIHTHTQAHRYVHTYTHTYINTHTYIHTYIHTHAHSFLPIIGEVNLSNTVIGTDIDIDVRNSHFYLLSMPRKENDILPTLKRKVVTTQLTPLVEFRVHSRVVYNLMSTTLDVNLIKGHMQII